MIIFNFVGLAMFVIGFAIAMPLCSALGIQGEGPPMIIAGPLVAIMDAVYRSRSVERQWFSPAGGGSLFFLPVWGFGIVWLFIGIGYTLSYQ